MTTAEHISQAASELQRAAAALRRARLYLDEGDLASAETERTQADAGIQSALAFLARASEQSSEAPVFLRGA